MTENVTPMTSRPRMAAPTTPQDPTMLQADLQAAEHALRHRFMDVHANINDALNLLAVIEDEVSINPKAASLAHALALLLRQALLTGQAMGYAPASVWWRVLWPQLLPRLTLPLLAGWA